MREISEDQGFLIRTSIWDKYPRVTNQDRSSKRYVSNITKTVLCRFIEIRKENPFNEMNGVVDLCGLLLNFQDLWSQIFGQELEIPQAEIIYQKGLEQAVKQCYLMEQAVKTQTQGFQSHGLDQSTDHIVFGSLPRAIFEMEKQVLIDYLRIKRPDTISVAFKPTGFCHLCGQRWNFRYPDRDELACSNRRCLGHPKRKNNDWIFLQNHSFLVGFAPKRNLSAQVTARVAKEYSELKEIQLLPIGHTNNLTEEVQNPMGWSQAFTCNQFIKWRGSLVGKTLETQMAPIPYKSAHAVIHAIKNYSRLPLKIKKVDWIQGTANRGVFALLDIPAGTVITTYVGEMYLGSQYPFWIYQDSAVEWGWERNDQILLFPFETANVGRFLNGSKTPEEANVEVRWSLIEGSSSLLFKGTNLPCLHLVMISRRNIKIREELTWFYGRSFNQNHGIGTEQKK